MFNTIGGTPGSSAMGAMPMAGSPLGTSATDTLPATGAASSGAVPGATLPGGAAPMATTTGVMPMATTTGVMPMATTTGATASSATPASSTAAGAATGAGQTTGTTDGSAQTATTSTANSQLAGTDTFLQLLVAQMRNQDPSQPMDDQSFVTELAQFNTVEQMLALKQAVDTQTSTQQSAEGVALLGKSVMYTVPGIGDNQGTTGQGVVSGVTFQGGSVQLQVGGQSVPLSQVTAVAGQ